MPKPRIIIADDHMIVAQGLTGLLEEEYDIAAIVEDGRSLVAAAKKLSPDVIVVDISMPHLNGIEAARLIAKVDRHVKFLFLTMHPDVAYVQAAFRAGASGYVLKRSAASELAKAIREILGGRSYLSPSISKEPLHILLRHSKAETPLDSLTPRQREVVQLVAEGRSMKETAVILNITPSTVGFHKYNAMDTLGIKSTADLVKFAIQQGLVAS